MREKFLSQLKAFVGEILQQAIVGGFVVLVGTFFVRGTHHVGILLPLGGMWICLVCFVEFASYKWFIPHTKNMIQLMGQEPPSIPEVKSFRQWFALRGWDLIFVLVLDVAVLFLLSAIFTKLLNIPW